MHIRAQQAYQKASYSYSSAFSQKRSGPNGLGPNSPGPKSSGPKNSDMSGAERYMADTGTGYSEATGIRTMQIPKARVTSREVGFSVGKFGLNYTSQNVAFDQEAISNLQGRKQLFEKELAHARKIENLRERTASFIPPEDAQPSQVFSMRQGIVAYARNASAQSYAQPAKRQLLATV